jgi:hypothetical protein
MSVYSTRDAYDAYITYLALQRHFTSSYDYFKYHGKVNASPQSFEIRKDKFQFYKLSKHPEYKNYIIANMVNSDKKIWVGDLLTNESDDIYKQWSKKIQSLSYHFKQEVSKLNTDFDSNFKVVDGQHPPLLNEVIAKRFSIEALIILDDILDIFKHWNSKIALQIIWDGVYSKSIKYKPFLHYDKSLMKKTLVDCFG